MRVLAPYLFTVAAGSLTAFVMASFEAPTEWVIYAVGCAITVAASMAIWPPDGSAAARPRRRP